MVSVEVVVVVAEESVVAVDELTGAESVAANAATPIKKKIQTTSPPTPRNLILNLSIFVVITLVSNEILYSQNCLKCIR